MGSDPHLAFMKEFCEGLKFQLDCSSGILGKPRCHGKAKGSTGRHGKI